MAKDLTVMRERFCEAYVREANGNGTKAAIIAGYSKSRAKVEASELLRDDRVVSRIKELRAEMIKESGYDKEQINKLIMHQLVSIAGADFTDYIRISCADDPHRTEVLERLKEINGGQGMIDFGDSILLPVEGMTETQRAAIKTLNLKHVPKSNIPEIQLELHNKMEAIKLLAEITGLKQSDSNVNLIINASEIAASAEERAQAYERHHNAETTD